MAPPIQARRSLTARSCVSFPSTPTATTPPSSARFAVISLTGDDIDVWQPITRSQFESLITEAARRVETCLLDTLERSGLALDEIDVVVRTGGSAQMPCFVEMMERIFGPDKVVQADVFSSVTAGLAIRASQGVEQK